MGIHSPLGNFIDVLCDVRESALINQARLSKSEASTRVVLIDPILKALGWDTGNPNMIEFEKTLPQSRADYALYNQENKIQVIIEAKALGINLGDKAFVLNLIMYALAAGIKDIFLTDGVVWEHYSDFTPGNVVSSKTIDLTKDNLLECAAYLVNELDAAQYWQKLPYTTQVINEQLSKEILDLRSEISNLKEALSLLQKPGSGIVNSQPAPDHNIIFTDLADLPNKLTGVNPPALIRLPDGNVKNISTWRDILVECCTFVLANNPSIPIPLPDAAGKKVKLLSAQPPAPGFSKYKTIYNGKEVYLYTNYDSKHCVINALHILKFLEPDKMKSTVAVLFKDSEE